METQWKIDYKKKPRKMTVDVYLGIRRRQYINFEKGKAAEKLFKEINGGSKNFVTKKGVIKERAIRTAHTNRFIDNILVENINTKIAREIKSGYLKNTLKNQKQILKDIDIVARNVERIKKVEWHLLSGIDEELIKYIHKFAERNKILDKITIVLY